MNRIHPRAAGTLGTVLAAVSLAGCLPHGDGRVAAEGTGLVREHVIDAPRNHPPVSSTLDYEILSVDGRAPERETLPPWVDEEPGVRMTVGRHQVVAQVAPHRRPPGYVPTRVRFDVEIADRKAYFLVDGEDGRPRLVEIQPQDPSP